MNELASHNHFIGTDKDAYMSSGGGSLSVHTDRSGGGFHGQSTNGYQYWVYASSAGGNAAHNNMPAYQTLYAWRRTG